MDLRVSFQEHYARGLSYLQARDHLGEAEASFRQALDLESDHVDALTQLGICLRAQGRLDEALETLQKADRQEPDTPLILAHLGTALRLKGRGDEALDHYSRALAIDPELIYARLNRAIMHRGARWTEALADIENLLARLPDDHTALSELRKKQAHLKGIVDAAHSLGVDPALAPRERAIAFYRCGNRLTIDGDLDRALQCYNATAELGADYVDPAYGVGDTVAIQRERHGAGIRLSCQWLESGLHFHEDRLCFCCVAHGDNKGWAPITSFHGGRLPIDHILARRAQLIRDNQSGQDTPCLGCHQLETKFWPQTEALFRELIVNSYTVCNMKCVYCDLAIGNFSRAPYSYFVEPLMDEMLAAGWLEPGTNVTWGGGDPSVSKEFSRCAAKLLEHGCRMNVNTNAVLLIPIVEEALRRGQCDLMISVDSGTPATFYRMKFNQDHEVISKGRPAFEAVWDHVARYAAAAPDAVVIKYIFTDRNAEGDDVDSFVDRCVSAGVRRIMLTPEASDFTAQRISRRVRDAMKQMIIRGRQEGLSVRYNFVNFPLDDGTLPEGLGPKEKRN